MTIEPPAPAMPVSGVPGGPGGYGESEIHLLDRLSVLYRYRNIVVAVVIVVLIGGAIQTYTTTKEYRATAVVQIDPDRPSIQGIAQGMFQDDEEYAFATELTKLHSHTLARRVARRLDLANNPEFNGQETQPTGLGDVLLSLRSRVTSPIMALFRREPVKPPAATVKDETKNPATAALAGAEPPEGAEEAARVGLLMGQLTATRQIGTRLVNVDVVSRHAQFAADAANAFVDEYVIQNIELKTAAIKIKREQYDLQVSRLADQLKAEKELFLKSQKATPNGVYIEPAQLAATVGASRTDWTRAQIESAKFEADYKRLSKYDLNDPAAVTAAAQTVPGMSTDQVVLNLLNDIQDKEKERKKLKVQGLGDENPKVLQVDTDLDSVRRQLKARLVSIVDTARQTFESAKATEDRYRNAYDAQNAMANEQAGQGIGLDFQQNKIKSDEELLARLQGQAEEARVEASATSNNVRKMDAAQVPTAPFKPDPARNMLLALLGGFILALGLAFGLDYLDDTIKTPEDITRKLHVPFLGLVPAVRGEKQPVLSGPVPHDFGESYRALRTSLVFTSGGESTRVITVTSAQPLEGKTTTACNLAMVLAFGGSRVLLMDADMRRPGVHKALKINNTVGLSHLLVGQARVREAIQRTSDPNFCVMTAGRTPPNPSELLSSERMRQLVANLKQGPFDWVVIDTPPVLAVTDAVILTPLVDGVTFVVGAEMTRRRLAERAVQMIMASRPKVVGAVLNRVNFDRNKYYYSRYYGYQYKSYYGTHTGQPAPAAKA